MSRPQRPLPPRDPRAVLDADGYPIEVGGSCGLFLDIHERWSAPAVGDWIATPAGSRYLIDSVRPVKRRTRRPGVQRFHMRCLRLPKNAAAPADVAVIEMSWYPRGRRA